MERVEEPDMCWEVWNCSRCGQEHCGDCVKGHTVDFEVWGKPDGYNQQDENWEGSQVCPWCYNQLIDISQKTQKEKR